MRRIFLSLVLLVSVIPALALSRTPYVTAQDVNLLQLLPPPPAPNSPAHNADHAAVVAAQKSRTAADLKRVEADAVATVFRFADVMGPNFTRTNLPKLDAFFMKVTTEVNILGLVAKEVWARPRPFVADPAIRLPGDMRSTLLSAPNSVSFSYPSNHAAFSAVNAILLSEMVPEKRAVLFARAREISEARIIGGMHYPSDVEAGRLYGTLAVAAAMKNPVFRADLAEVKAELRKVLNLRP